MSAPARYLAAAMDAWRTRAGTEAPPSRQRAAHRRTGPPSLRQRAPGVYRDAPMGERGRRAANRPLPADDASRLQLLLLAPAAAGIGAMLLALAWWLLG